MNDRFSYLRDPAAAAEEDRLAAVESFQRLLVERGLAPDPSRLPHKRMRVPLRVLIGLVLALNVAVLVMLGNFVVFNMMLHVSL